MINNPANTGILYSDESYKKISCPHVLLVDDEDFLVNLWKSVLEKHGYRVSGYTDGKLALADFKSNPKSFDIVITDQSMPYITGDVLAAELFKIRSDIKIIICTGYLQALNMKNSSGICEFLLKPFDNNILIRAIRRNLQEI